MSERVSSELVGHLVEYGGVEMTPETWELIARDLLDARRERDEAREELASEELASEGRWRDTYQLKVIELERQLTAANRALVWVTAYPKSRQRGLAPSDVVVAIDSARAAEGGEG
jgi:hypothetical protein